MKTITVKTSELTGAALDWAVKQYHNERKRYSVIYFSRNCGKSNYFRSKVREHFGDTVEVPEQLLEVNRQ